MRFISVRLLLTGALAAGPDSEGTRLPVRGTRSLNGFYSLSRPANVPSRLRKRNSALKKKLVFPYSVKAEPTHPLETLSLVKVVYLLWNTTLYAMHNEWIQERKHQEYTFIWFLFILKLSMNLWALVEDPTIPWTQEYKSHKDFFKFCELKWGAESAPGRWDQRMLGDDRWRRTSHCMRVPKVNKGEKQSMTHSSLISMLFTSFWNRTSPPPPKPRHH